MRTCLNKHASSMKYEKSLNEMISQSRLMLIYVSEGSAAVAQMSVQCIVIVIFTLDVM